MTQRQHVITEWLLKHFARPEPGGLTLSVYDKTTGSMNEAVPSRFMAPIDDHGSHVESALGRLESDAAPAVTRLLARAATVTVGLWALYGETDNLTGPSALSEVQVPAGDVRVFAPTRWLAEPSADDRARIARYLALMFTRSPTMERAISEVGVAVRAGYVQMVKAEAPALLTPMLEVLDGYLDDARFIGLRTPDELTDAFAAMDWYLVRAPDDAPLVLGDSPVVSTIQVGHEEDAWRPLLSPETYAVCMPLSAAVCLVVAPQGLMPIGVEKPDEMADAINRLTWRWADRHVIGPTEASLERIRDAMPPANVRQTLPIDVEPDKAFGRGLLTAWKVLNVELERLGRYCTPLSPLPDWPPRRARESDR